MILALKLLLAPIFIAISTLAGRRWGPAVSGWMTGFPFISAPISLVLALQNGTQFAANAAIGIFAGQTSMCFFCLVYILAARKWTWWQSLPPAILTFFAATFLWNQFTLSLFPTLAILLVVTVTLLILIPGRKIAGVNMAHPWWDLPARMLTAAAFVALLTGFASVLGPTLSGMLSAFPVFGTVLSTFTHAQQGGEAAGQLLRGSILGSFGIAAFYVVIGLVLPLTGSLWTYLLAVLATLVASRISLEFTRPRRIVNG